MPHLKELAHRVLIIKPGLSHIFHPDSKHLKTIKNTGFSMKKTLLKYSVLSQVVSVCECMGTYMCVDIY